MLSGLTYCCANDRTPLANSPDWLKSAPMQENLLASWRQSGQKQDPCPSLLNYNAKYKRLLPPYCDFANGVRTFLIQIRAPPSRTGSPHPGADDRHGGTPCWWFVYPLSLDWECRYSRGRHSSWGTGRCGTVLFSV